VISGSPDALKASLNGDILRVALVEPESERVRGAASAVPGLRDLIIETHGPTGQLIARTDDASSVVGPTITALEAAGVVFGAVSASRPSLDDVYLHYAGRSFAGADALEHPSTQTQAGRNGAAA
jgi:ABC-2 type transport system ATP-binding protein